MRPAERGGHRVAREIVFGRAQAAGQHDDLRARHSAQNGVGEPRALVADYGLAHHFHAQRVELIGEIERIGVEPSAASAVPSRSAMISASGIREEACRRCRRRRDKSALLVVTSKAREGVKARPTIPGPERNSSGDC